MLGIGIEGSGILDRGRQIFIAVLWRKKVAGTLSHNAISHKDEIAQVACYKQPISMILHVMPRKASISNPSNVSSAAV